MERTSVREPSTIALSRRMSLRLDAGPLAHALRSPTVWAVALLIGADVAVLWPMLVAGGIPMHGDLAFPLTLERFGAQFSPLWNPYSSVSNLENADRLLTAGPLIVIAAALGLSMATLVKALFLGVLLLSQLSMYRFVTYTHEALSPPDARLPGAAVSGGALAAAVLYGYSPWVMPAMSAIFFWIAYAVLPLALLLLTIAVVEKKFVYAGVAALAWTFGAGSPHFTFFLGLALVSWGAYLGLSRVAHPRTVACSLAVLVGTFVVVNAYWMWPIVRSWAVQTVTPGYVTSITDVEMLSRQATAFNVLLGRDDWFRWWHSATLDGYGPRHWLWLTAAVLILAVAVLGVLRSRSRYADFFVVVVVLSFLLAQGSRGPTWSLYKWLMFDAPGAASWGWLLRAPGKFGFFFWFGVSVLLAAGAIHLGVQQRVRFLGGFRSGVLIAIIALVFTLPKLTAGTWGPYEPVTIPDDYTRVNSWLDHRPRTGKVLWLAPYEYGSSPLGEAAYTWAPDRLVGYVFARSSPRPSYGGYHFTNPFAQYQTYLEENLDSPGLWKLLAAPGIRYVVYQADVLGAGWRARLDLSHLKQNLALAYRAGSLYVFRNERYSGAISTPASTLVVHGGLRAMRLLAESSAVDPRRTTLLFADQDAAMVDLPNAATLAYNVTGKELSIARLLASRGTIVWPFDATVEGDAYIGWARMRTSNPYDGHWPWHRYLRLSVGEQDPFDFDYGRGVVAAFAPAKLELSAAVREAGVYGIYLRVLRHSHGGRVTVTVNGNLAASLDTTSPAERFHWELVARVPLRAGSNDLVLTNIAGDNVVGAVGLLKSSAIPVAPRNFLYLGEPVASTGRASLVSLPHQPRTSLRLRLKSRTKRIELKLVPEGASVSAAARGRTVEANVRDPRGGDFYLLAGERVHTVATLAALRWTTNGERVLRRSDGGTADRARSKRQQRWQSTPVQVKPRERLYLAWKISGSSIADAGLRIFWSGPRRASFEDAMKQQTGTFDFAGAIPLQVPAGATRLTLQIVARRLSNASGRWRLARLELSRIEHPVTYLSVLSDPHRVESLSRARAPTPHWSRRGSAAGPYVVSFGGALAAHRLVRLSESFDPYWVGQGTIRGGEARDLQHVAAFSVVNAFVAPRGTTAARIFYGPQLWRSTALKASAACAIGLLLVAAYVAASRRRRA